MRYRWDLLHASGLKIGDGIGITGDIKLYAYMDDGHIDTALRSFIKPLEVAKKVAADTAASTDTPSSSARRPRP